ncbi:MAG: T9SS type A sorting domain-containing protein [Bacteroidota bacterium]
MKYIVTFLVFILALQAAKGQNLVPNPSFEQYDTCPNFYGGNNLSNGWYSFRPSPDYFNICSTSSLVGVPYNAFGSQSASTGNAYCGFTSYRTDNINELLGRKLSTALLPGTKYYVSIKVCLAGCSPCGIDKIGVLFSTVSYCDSLDSFNVCYSAPAPLTNYAPVYSSQIITDTTNWTTITGSFVADSAYQYIIIGNLFDYTHTNYILLYGNTSCFNSYVYYYVDDICMSTDSLTCYQTNDISENLISNEIIIFPNPSDNYVYIHITNDNHLTFTCNIINIYGKIIQQLINPSTVDVSDLPNGIYLFQIRSGNKILNEKITINH